MIPSSKPEEPPSTMRKYLIVAILCLINLLNYMDRYTVAGVLSSIQGYYKINDATAGLLQTVFIIAFMLCSPVCGYLGDRYNRKIIMVAGISVWIFAVVASSFVPANMFWLFATLRAVVGVGEASYITVSPTIIADMFSGNHRSRMLMVFYFAIPFGSGLGYVVGSAVANALGAWQWGIRVTAVLGAICIALIVLFVEEPKRGGAESTEDQKQSSYMEDLKSLIKNITYVTSTLGYTAIVFVVGTMSWWVPTAIQHGEAWKAGQNSTSDFDETKKSHVSTIFGGILLIGGLAGVTIGSLTAQWMKSGFGPFRLIKTQRADPIVCAVGAILAIPTFFFGIQFIKTNETVAWVLMFICITGLCFNWAINVDLLMTVVTPNRRNSANSWQILTSHLLGDASGPYIIGLISDTVRGDDTSPKAKFESLVTAFRIPNVLLLVSVVFFIAAAAFFRRDRQKFLKAMEVDKETDDKENKQGGRTNKAFEDLSIEVH